MNEFNNSNYTISDDDSRENHQDLFIRKFSFDSLNIV